MDDFLNSPPVRVACLIITVGIISSVLPLLFLLNTRIPVPVLKWLVIIVVGLSAGLTARILLKNAPLGFQFAAAVAGLVIGSLLIGQLTLNFIGFAGNIGMDVFASLRWGAELLLASSMAAMTIHAWQASTPKIRVPSRNTKIKTRPKINKNGHPVLNPKNRIKKTGRTKNAVQKIPADYPGRNNRSQRTVSVNPSVRKEKQFEKTKVFRWKAIQRGMLKLWEDAQLTRNRLYRKLFNPSPSFHVRKGKGQQPVNSSSPASTHVRLFGEVEHRCPYCLEVVVKKDARGVKICPICQTHHHLDCWNITGMCQVPHQSE